MTERERDERDLKILQDREQNNASVVILARRYNTTQRYVKQLLVEALAEEGDAT